MPWIIEEEEEAQEVAPKSKWIIEDEVPKKPSRVKIDVVSDELRNAGYEPDASEEFERAAERGQAEGTRGIISGASGGVSEHIPGLDTEDNIASTTGKLAGSVLPITGISKAVGAVGAKVFSKPLMNLAAKSPVAAKALNAFGNIVGAGATGATYEAGTTLAKGEMPSVEDVTKHGAEWAALDAILQTLGLGGRFAKALLTKSKEVAKPSAEVLNETINTLKKQGVDFSEPERASALALSILEKPAAQATKAVKPAQKSEAVARMERDAGIKQKVRDIQDKNVPVKISELHNDIAPLAEPYIPENLNAIEIAEETGNKALNDRISTVSQRASTEQELGKNIQEDLKVRLQEAEDLYKPAYDLAEEAGSTIYHVPLNTSKTAGTILEKIQGMKTNPEGYKKVVSSIENILEDAGFNIEKDASGKVVQIVSEKEIPTDKIMELGRRVGKLINYETIDKSIVDQLKPIQQAIKQDIRAALREKPEALELWNEAERQFGETAQKFGRDSIRSIRKLEATEKAANLIKNPTTLSDLKNTLSEPQYAQVERELLETLNGMTEAKAASTYRELRPHLSPESQSIAEEILESKVSKESPIRSERINKSIKDSLYNDLARASETGERPSTALNLWKTKKGQQLIKEALKDTPNKDEIIKYLQDQSFYDFASSFTSSSGKIDYKKFNKLLQDPMTVENLRQIGGEEAVNFFRHIEDLSKRIDANLKAIENIPSTYKGKELLKSTKAKNVNAKQEAIKNKQASWKYQAEKFLKSYKLNSKLLLGILGITTIGVLPAAKAGVALEGLYFLAKSKKAQAAFKKAASSRTNPTAMFSALETIQDEFED